MFKPTPSISLPKSSKIPERALKKLMKIAIDIREAGDEKTGKGWYTFNLVNEMIRLDRQNQYLLYTDNAKSPFAKSKNVQIKTMKERGSWKFPDYQGNRSRSCR